MPALIALIGKSYSIATFIVLATSAGFGQPCPECKDLRGGAADSDVCCSGSPASATGGLPATGAPGGSLASDAGLAASRSQGSTPVGAAPSPSLLSPVPVAQ